MFDNRILLSNPTNYLVDFTTITISELKSFQIEISWYFESTGICHGIAGWFDINLGGFVLSTAPNAEKTHWQQVRFLFKEPLAVNAFETVHGTMSFNVNNMRSYDISAEIFKSTEAVSPISKASSRSGFWKLHEQSYYYEEQSSNQVYFPEYGCIYPPEEVERGTMGAIIGIDGIDG